MLRIIIVSILFVFSFWPTFAQTTTKIGVVDGDKLFDEYPGVQDASKRIADAQDDLKNAISESEKIYTEFEKQKKSEAEKLTKRKELQAKIDTKAQDTKKIIESISSKIEDEILQAIKKISGEKSIDVVFDKRAVLTGGTDITEAVAELLRKKSPPANESPPSVKESDSKKTN